MQLYLNPPPDTWPSIAARPVMDLSAISERVKPIMAAVKQQGDAAIRQYSLQFDGIAPDNLLVSEAEISAAIETIDPALLDAMKLAAANIEAFHSRQLLREPPMETMPGVTCWRQSRAIEKVGLYIPGGTAPLFSTILMLGIPAKLAGCRDIVLCTPPAKDGSLHPAMLAAAHISGISRIAKVGGAQAIAAMTYGTESIPAVYKIFGPGNQYVTAAKQLAQLEGVAIDMPAGPSEVCVWANEDANPAFVAADLLSQAEHGSDSQVVFITSSADFARQVANELNTQLQALPRKEMAAAALQNSRTIVMDNAQQALAFINLYAPEHLIINQPNGAKLAEAIQNAGSIFIGDYTPESAGDYASGTNHTLPTNGYARAWSGVSIDSFIKKITVQQISREGLAAIGPAIVAMAEAEGLQAHANAVTVRLQSQKDIA